MPRHPHVAPATKTMTGSLFSKLTHRIAAISGERFALHVGDTYLPPPLGRRWRTSRRRSIQG
jgi:hypothetical protein